MYCYSMHDSMTPTLQTSHLQLRERVVGVPSNLAEHNKYLILIPERITLSPRAYMQFHNQERQLISLCEIQKCHAARESA